MKIKVELSEEAKNHPFSKDDPEYFLPKKKPGDAGFDLRACIPEYYNLLDRTIHNLYYSADVDEEYTIFGGSARAAALIPTGVKVSIQSPDIAAVVLPRSGLGHRDGIILGNSVGLIDSTYEKEIFISIWNRSITNFHFNAGDRLAQLVFLPIINPELELVQEIPDKLNRGGFGSTGVK